jgi:hypothetical protein
MDKSISTCHCKCHFTATGISVAGLHKREFLNELGALRRQPFSIAVSVRVMALAKSVGMHCVILFICDLFTDAVSNSDFPTVSLLAEEPYPFSVVKNL